MANHAPRAARLDNLDSGTYRSPSPDDLRHMADAVNAFAKVAKDARPQPDQAAAYRELAECHQLLRDRHRAMEQALDLERRRRETFVATLAHELRQPLSALLAAVHVVRLAPGSAAASQSTEVMTRQIGQMSRIVADVIDATRWACGKVALCKQRIDVRDVVREVGLDAAAAVAERGHRLVIAPAREPLWVDADPQRLRQLLSNLLHNAVRCTDPGGRIVLAAERLAATVILRVSDTGRGIGPDDLPHIFELFSQVQSSDSTGLGIGLSVAQEIALLHDGGITVRSDGPGHGSEFIVTLPHACPQKVSHMSVRPDHVPHDAAGACVTA